MASASTREVPDLTGYEVLVAVCGGIAAYKVATLVSSLVQRGAGVSVAMTKAARKFITPLTFEALTARPVFTNVWQTADVQQHLSLTEVADLFIIAPATANILGKLANGIADDLVSNLGLSAASPLLLAPAMNTRMWEHPAVQANLRLLVERGAKAVGPNEGWLACRAVGKGRMAEPDEILAQAVSLLQKSPPKRSTGR
ncbi:MAG: phosphopantothenoylcysteine decarboxylase [Planctomycetes bacterium]|nr:phosphopantothenoylcysteine decarboxylase [Planctomycetota bacterium]